MTVRPGFVVVSMFALLSCSSDSSTSAGPRPADTTLARAGWRPTAIAFLGSPPEMSTPAGVNVNDTALVSFTVWLVGCVREVKNEIAVVGLEADVRSYQLEYLPEESEGCTNQTRIESSTAPVIFTQPGHARIRLFGRDFPSNGPVMAERNLMVVP